MSTPNFCCAWLRVSVSRFEALVLAHEVLAREVDHNDHALATLVDNGVPISDETYAFVGDRRRRCNALESMIAELRANPLMPDP